LSFRLIEIKIRVLWIIFFYPHQYGGRSKKTYTIVKVLSKPYNLLKIFRFQSLKVVGNEKGEGSGEWLLFEDGFRPWRSMSVYCLMLPSSFLPFPLCIAQLIGDWYENRRGAPKCSVRFFLFCPPIGDFYGTFYLTSLSIFCVRCAISNSAGGICAPIYWRTDVSLRQ
jgi:hypothetical protein